MSEMLPTVYLARPLRSPPWVSGRSQTTRLPSGARKILTAARWCFLNSGFAKTAFADIAKRSNLSRTLLYWILRDK